MISLNDDLIKYRTNRSLETFMNQNEPLNHIGT